VNTNMALGPLVGSSARRLVRPSARPPVRFAAEPSLDMPRMLIPMRLCTVSMISFHSFEPSLPNAFACRYKYSLDTPSSMTNTGLIRELPRAAHPCCQNQVLRCRQPPRYLTGTPPSQPFVLLQHAHLNE
jgi:hypothetical protein